MVKAKIDGIEIEVEEGTSILDAARMVNVKIPTLCKHPDLHATSACGICVVKIAGRGGLVRACATPVENGMDITTRDAELVKVRRNVIELILSKHPNECLTCIRNGNCELQKLAADFGIRRASYTPIVPDLPKDDTTKSIVLDPRKCILCGRCVQVCQEVQNVWALSFFKRGINTQISAASGISLAESPCIKCGQCSAHCPTGAITEYDNTLKTWRLLDDKTKHKVVQIAPAVRVAIGEEFGFKAGEITTGKLYAALRRIGFDAVFDTNFGADVTIMEEASEFVARFTKHTAPLPLITSCCPSWVDFMEKYCPDMIPNFSSCKSPHEMLGALTKTYYAQKKGLNPENIAVVSIMPCTSKKWEIVRSKDMFSSGVQDVDVSLTTREIARMMKQSGIDFANLQEEKADSLLGEYSGAGTIFGYTGGVMEAALRTAYYLITGEDAPNPDFTEIRGLEGIKTAEIDIKGTKVKVAAAHGTGNLEKLIKIIQEARDKGEEPPFHFVEVMACNGGCVGGGGQPVGVTDSLRKARTAGLENDDKKSAVRQSHKNSEVQELYKEFLGKPLSDKSHELLHTHYTPRTAYKR
jgi:NADH-quinone oxidoreductase subunit G